ncbi:MAG: hypothetical protein HYR97_00960 [Candidatus Melainabacteria bacterium]|nr:hypothetical protein [Candidatus Melainabacteria bacterium]
MVLGHNLNNNWKVKVNGKEENLYKANLVQRAVYLPGKGDYIVKFYYFPKLFMIGLGLSLVGIIILIMLAAILKIKSKK